MSWWEPNPASGLTRHIAFRVDNVDAVVKLNGENVSATSEAYDDSRYDRDSPAQRSDLEGNARAVAEAVEQWLGKG